MKVLLKMTQHLRAVPLVFLAACGLAAEPSGVPDALTDAEIEARYTCTTDEECERAWGIPLEEALRWAATDAQ